MVGVVASWKQPNLRRRFRLFPAGRYIRANARVWKMHRIEYFLALSRIQISPGTSENTATSVWEEVQAE
jgi:hypothetical protein